jgi:hypothetical protein
MASPFRFFRKHTKVFMAVATVLCMLIFVVGDALLGNGPAGGNAGADATVATWKGGAIDRGQLAALIQHRLITNDFLLRLFGQGGGRSEYDLPLDIPTQGILLNAQQQREIEQVVIQSEIEADLAKQAGITVSDDLISDYIQKMGLNNLTAEQVDLILASVGNGNPRTSEGIVMGTLRKLLAAHLYTRMYADPALVMLPHQRWNDWKQVNDRISLQVAVLPVEKFLADVPQPTEEELKAFYNDFKDYDPGRRMDVGGRLLNSPDPGFAEPRRVRLQYLKGSAAELTEKMLDKVTDADIAYYYEQNKEDFLKMDVPGAPAAPSEPATGSESEQPSPSEEEPAAETSAEEPAAEPSTEAAPSEPVPPAEESADNVEEPAAEVQEPATASEPQDEQSSNGRQRSPFRLASFQEEQPADGSADEAEATAESESADAEASTDAEAEGAPASTESAASEAASTPPANETPATSTSAAADEYEPLESVRDEIRRTLARELAMKELDRIMGEAMAQLQTDFNTYGIALVEAEEAGKKVPKPPAKLADLQWLADKNGLVYEKTTPLTFLELFDTPLGKAVGASGQEMTVAQAAFTTLKLYEPFLASELDDVVYVVLKTEDVPRRIPEFDEVRDEVATAWKQREAAKLAEKKAKELAAEIEKSNTPFDQFFFADRGYEVINETAQFSWLNYPAGRAGYGSPPMLSEVPELKSVGPEFMETAFSLEGQEAKGLLNHDQTAAYVIRLARKQWSDEDLKKLFLEESESWLGGRDMLFKHASRFNSAVEQDMFKDRAGLEFDEEWLKERQNRQQR